MTDPSTSRPSGCEHDWFRNGDPSHGCCLLCGVDEFPQEAANRLRREREALTSENARLRADVTEANFIIHAAAKFVPNNAPLIIAVEDWLDEHPHPSDESARVASGPVGTRPAGSDT